MYVYIHIYNHLYVYIYIHIHTYIFDVHTLYIQKSCIYDYIYIAAYRVLSPETVTRQPRRLAVTVRRIRDEASEDGGLNIPSWFHVEKPSGVELDVKNLYQSQDQSIKKELQNQGTYSKN